MKRVVVMSDNHGNHEMLDIIKDRESNADFYIHCGDSEATKEDVEGWICVQGNNDWSSNFAKEIVVAVEDVRFLVCHGHRLGYFDRENKIIDILQRNNAQVLLSGHTHIPDYKKIGGYYSVNPGSTNLPRGGSGKSYCVIIVDGIDIDVEFKEL